MRDEQEGQLQFALEALELLLHRFAELEVEGRERLVQEKDRGLRHEGPGERDALLLPPGELLGLAERVVVHVDELESLSNSTTQLGTFGLLSPQTVRHVVEDVEMREEGVVLKDRIDVAGVGGEAGRVTVAEQDAPAVDLLETSNEAEGGGLSATRRTEQREELAGLDREGEVVDDGPRAGLTAERLGDLVEHD